MQLVLRCAERGFPDAALAAFAVADNHEDAVLLIVQLCAQAKTDAEGKAMSETAGGGLHAGHFSIFRVPTEDSIARAKPPKLFLGKKSFFGQEHIERDTAMALA